MTTTLATQLTCGGRVVLRSEGLPDIEYALFDPSEIELCAISPGSTRESCYRTTASAARTRLAGYGIDHAMFEATFEAVASVAEAYARGPAVKKIVPRLSGKELFASRTYDADKRLYLGTFVDLFALAADAQISPTAIQAFYLYAIIAELEDEDEIVLSTLDVMRGRRSGERSHKRPVLERVAELPSQIRGMEVRDNASRAAPIGLEDLATLFHSLGEELPEGPEQERFFALERACLKRTPPTRGPLADPELWDLEQQLDEGDAGGVLAKLDATDRAKGRGPGTAYLRARVSLLLGTETPKLIAERVSALSLSMTQFPELEFLAAEAWVQAGDLRRAFPYAREIADSPHVDPHLRARAQAILDRAVEAGIGASILPAAPRASQDALSAVRPDLVPASDRSFPPRPLSSDRAHVAATRVPEPPKVPPPAPTTPNLDATPSPPPGAVDDSSNEPIVSATTEIADGEPQNEFGSFGEWPPSSKPPPIVPKPVVERSAKPPPPPPAKPATTGLVPKIYDVEDLDDAATNPRLPAADEPPPSRRPTAPPAPPAALLMSAVTTAPGPHYQELGLTTPPKRDIPSSFPKSARVAVIEERSPSARPDPRSEPPEAVSIPGAPAVPGSTATFDSLEGDAPQGLATGVPVIPPSDPAIRVSRSLDPGRVSRVPGAVTLAPKHARPKIQKTTAELPKAPGSAPGSRPGTPQRTVSSGHLASAVSSSPSEAGQPPPLPPRARFMKGASQPPLKTENPPPLLSRNSLVPKADDGPELAEYLSLPQGVSAQGVVTLDPLPKTPLAARVAFTLLSRELGAEYRKKHATALLCDLRGLEAMQGHLFETFPDHAIKNDLELHDVRKHGAFLSEVLARVLDAQWIDVSSPDLGHWAMVVPPNTRVWPFGRVMRLVAKGHKERDLVSYFFELEKRASK